MKDKGCSGCTCRRLGFSSSHAESNCRFFLEAIGLQFHHTHTLINLTGTTVHATCSRLFMQLCNKWMGPAFWAGDILWMEWVHLLSELTDIWADRWDMVLELEETLCVDPEEYLDTLWEEKELLFRSLKSLGLYFNGFLTKGLFLIKYQRHWSWLLFLILHEAPVNLALLLEWYTVRYDKAPFKYNW